MEPAGSHGVHSLDDFQFLCFLFGSVQMGCQNDLPEPTCFAETPVVNKFGEKYMFLQAIQHINNVKTGPFAEHSNTLWGVSGARSWDKVRFKELTQISFYYANATYSLEVDCTLSLAVTEKYLDF